MSVAAVIVFAFRGWLKVLAPTCVPSGASRFYRACRLPAFPSVNHSLAFGQRAPCIDCFPNYNAAPTVPVSVNEPLTSPFADDLVAAILVFTC